MTFNQELIEKARKGEIAILNDGSVEELQGLMNYVRNGTGNNKKGLFLYYLFNKDIWQQASNEDFFKVPAYSVKDFFMTNTEYKVSNGNAKTVMSENERTYKVTRQQMQQIWAKVVGSVAIRIENIVDTRFYRWNNEANLDHFVVQEIVNFWTADSCPLPDIVKEIFPEYFFIPDGEPVLVRNEDTQRWVIRISDGKGGCYIDGEFSGNRVNWKQIIPYTKTPPK